MPNDIYTSSDFPPHISLPLHHEKPRSKNPPHHLYFCCVTPPERNGGTLLAQADAIWSDIPELIQKKIIEHGVQYKQFYHGKTMKYIVLKKIFGNGTTQRWSHSFGTEDKRQIERILKQDVLTVNWLNHGNDLIVLNQLPGALKHPITNNILWFNSSHYLNYYSNLCYGELHKLNASRYAAAKYIIYNDILPLVCHYGNGEAISAEDIKKINEIMQYHTRVLNWQAGDFAIIDNFTFMHGKQAHQGNRLLYSCMSAQNHELPRSSPVSSTQ